MAIFSMFILLLHFPFSVISSTLMTFEVPSGGPESYLFVPTNEIFITGVNDGRILIYTPGNGFENFAYASPKRPESCDGTTDRGHECGRALGLAANYKTKRIYIADAYFGLNEVGMLGGQATQIANSAEGLPFKWLDGIDVDQTTGKVYFTDVSRLYNFSQVTISVSTGDATGRFIEYDPDTRRTRVLLRDLQGPGGVATSEDGSFVLLSEFTGNRITKYWLTGPKADKAELLLNISGPANIKKRRLGNFYWVAVNDQSTGIIVPTAVLIDEYGNIRKTLSFPGAPYNGSAITEAQEHGKRLYFGSVYVSFGAYTI